MESIRIIKRSKPLQNIGHGDIDVYGLQDWLHPFVGSEFKRRKTKSPPRAGSFYKNKEGSPKLLPLGYLHENPWKAIENCLKIDTTELKDDCIYACPFTDRDYHACVPYAIETKNLERFIPFLEEYPYVDEWTIRMFRDQEFVIANTWWETDDIDTLLMGSGHTECILPCDGGSDTRLSYLDIGEGDKLLVWHFRWFNK